MSQQKKSDRRREFRRTGNGENTMERNAVIEELENRLHFLTRLHIQHRLEHTESFRQQKEQIRQFILDNAVDVRRELSAVSLIQYRRYFD